MFLLVLPEVVDILLLIAAYLLILDATWFAITEV